MDQVLSIMGLGKLGAATLATFASRGWNVIGIDINKKAVDAINEHRSPIDEPDVDRLLKENGQSIIATTDVQMGILDSDVTFVIVPTPSLPDGSFSIEYVKTAVRSIAQVLPYKNTYHVINVTSTVLLGDMEQIKALIEEVSGKKCGIDFGLVYNPDFIALGKVVYDLTHPDMILIGQDNDRDGQLIEDIHRSLVIWDNPNIFRMSFYNAELAKISLNHFLTLKIGYANTIAEICENMPTGDAEKVLNAIGADTRIGYKYMKAGLSPSGACLPRDSRAFVHTASRFGVDAFIAKAVDHASNEYKKRILNKIIEILSEIGKSSISVLGLSFKEGTPVIEESVSIYVVKELFKKGYTISVYDPMAMENARKELGKDIKFSESAIECLKGTSLCFIATAWKEFRDLQAVDFVENMESAVVLDVWGVLPYESFPGIRIIRTGKNYAIKDTDTDYIDLEKLKKLHI